MQIGPRTRSSKTGLPPGTLVHIGEAGESEASIAVVDYDGEHLEERTLAEPEDVAPYLESPTVTWVDFCGVHDVDRVSRLGALLGIHPLVLEDVVNTHQRPKAEVYEGYLFLVLKMIRYDPEDGDVDVEQVGVVLGKGLVVTFQEHPGDVFNPIRERIRTRKGRIRKSGPDYLAYALLDVIVDHYFLALEGVGVEIEELEEDLVADPRREVMEAIHALKRVMVTLRKAVWPLREAILSLERSDSDLIQPTTQPYLRDVYDHTIQVIDTVEAFRDVLAGYLDLYLTSISNRMNEVMKVLTIIATIFIPLTFIAGVYGMNFQYMPELAWRWAYPAVWAVMAAIAVLMMVYFRRKRWL